ncbi:MAG: hypothetical protein ACI9LV_000168 [Candidatus Nanohaloarchaea archaeon]|jgi:hypothetical protein
MSGNYQRQDPSSDRYVNRRAEEVVIDETDDHVYEEKQRGPERFYEELTDGNIGLRSGNVKFDPDLYIDEDSDVPEDIDSFTYIDSITHALETSPTFETVSLDSDRGYIEFEAYRGNNWHVFVPFIDENNASLLMEVENPWTEEFSVFGYNRQNNIPDNVEEEVARISYDLCREAIPEIGIPVENKKEDWLKRKLAGFHDSDAFDQLEKGPQVATFDDDDNIMNNRGRMIPIEISKFSKALKNARVIDYTTDIFAGDQNKIEVEGGGYKLVTDAEDPMELIEDRLPDRWKN